MQFPDKWKTQITRQQVAASPLDGNALIVLNAVVESADPLDGARALERAAGAPLIDKTRRITIGDLQAARTHLQARSNQGELSVEFAWVGFAGRVYQVTGIARRSAVPPR